MKMVRASMFLVVASGLLAAACFAEEPQREAVNAPYAAFLVKQEMAAHPEIVFLGLHATPPGKTNNLIVARRNPDKIGLVSTDADMDENGALRRAIVIQKELQKRISDRDQLFKAM